MKKTQDFKIESFGLANYRSFGPEFQFFGPFAKLNLFIGPNNSGKSNLLKFISELMPDATHSIRNGQAIKLLSDDRHLRTDNTPIRICFRTNFSVERFEEKLKKRLTEGTDYALPVATYFLQKAASSTLVLTYEFESQATDSGEQLILTNKRAFIELLERLTNDMPRSTVGLEANARKVGEMLATDWNGVVPVLDKVPLIPAIRRITLDQNHESFDGVGLVGIIASWINHRGKERDKKQKKEILTDFVRTVTGYRDAILTAADGDKEIELNTDGEAYPLQEVATGLHDLVLLAAYCLFIEESVICIEEPECHLHPIWQRSLLRYLMDNTSNQYFISTHSAHIIDIPGVSVFSLYRDRQVSKTRPAMNDSSLLELLRDLGYRASDLLQSNYILWVEGPSDRLYILHWLSVVAPELTEGIHFSIMFYSGSLLKHLSVSNSRNSEQDDDTDDATPEPVFLRRLNQNFGMVMDSDRTDNEVPGTRKWQRICRIQKELADENLFSWITDGRTTENYTSSDTMVRAIEAMNRGYSYRIPKNDFDAAFKFLNTKNKEAEDKVGMAEQYIRQLAEDAMSKDHNPQGVIERDYFRSKMSQELQAHIERLAIAITAVQVT